MIRNKIKEEKLPTIEALTKDELEDLRKLVEEDLPKEERVIVDEITSYDELYTKKDGYSLAEFIFEYIDYIKSHCGFRTFKKW